MKIVETRIVYQGKEPALFPGVTRAGNGDLLVSFCTRFDCQPGGKAYLLRSTNQGMTWELPTRLLRSGKPDGCINLSVGLTTLRDGTVLYPCCDARITRRWDQHDADLIVLRSENHGYTWTPPKRVGVEMKEPFAYGKIIELRSGDLLCPIWGKRAEDEPWRSGLLRSRDGGASWGDHVTIAYDPQASPIYTPKDPSERHCGGFNETTLVELQDGQILAILRQQGVQGGVRELHRAISSDEGRTWSSPTRLDVWGTSPSLHLDAGGSLWLGYRNHRGNPQGLPAPGVGLSRSHDAGQTWSDHLLLEDPKGYAYQQEFEAGYPAFLNLEDGRLLVIFYSYDPTLPAERYLAANLLC
jgi:hypothetical protein